MRGEVRAGRREGVGRVRVRVRVSMRVIEGGEGEGGSLGESLGEPVFVHHVELERRLEQRA